MQPKFELDQPLMGFDETVLPNWLMVPLNEEKQIFLRSGDGMTINSVNPRIAEVRVVDPIFSVAGANGRRTCAIKGNTHGHTFIEVRDDKNRLHARLEVAVKKQKTVKLAFNFVEDSAQHKTARALNDVEPWINTLNNLIYTPQTNIVFELESSQWIKVNANLGNVIGTTGSHKPDAWVAESNSVTAQRKPAADINLFFVWEYDIYNAKKPSQKDTIEGITFDTDCLIEDNLTGDPTGLNTIAHEIGHALGVSGESHYYKNRNDDGLMYYASSGFRIGKIHTNMINR